MSGLDDIAGRDDVAARSVASRWYIAVSIVPHRAKPGSAEWRHRAASTAEDSTISRSNAEWLAGMAADLPKTRTLQSLLSKARAGTSQLQISPPFINLDLRK
ncbi:hypothetical protein [Bradyrhizobium sp. Rc2d]|uniref:hypothetical protein n=1 Tax=Bradyrhizobium sp. Rc2d TaxID=1855321 RepID=UPI000B81A371|nr:hypothetical protein [Bradyrhizobium sp. Rc2d]